MGDGEGRDVGARDGPGVGAEFGEFSGWCVIDWEGLVVGAIDGQGVGAIVREI